MDEFAKHELSQMWKWRHLVQVFYFVATVKNWAEVLMMHFGLRKPGFIKLRNGLTFVASPPIFNGVDMFHNEPYKRLDVLDGTVIDVGGFVGDSALYFVSKGASKVVAYEPVPDYCYLFEQNMKLNSIGNVILHKNAVTSLEEVAIQDAVLKLDCEGDEYNLLLSASNLTLQKFQEIILEYHNAYPPLVRRLRDAKFQVQIIQQYDGLHGILFARRPCPVDEV